MGMDKQPEYKCTCGSDYESQYQARLRYEQRYKPADSSYVLRRIQKKFCNCCVVIGVLAIWLLPFFAVQSMYLPDGNADVMSSMLGTFCSKVIPDCWNKTDNTTSENWAVMDCQENAKRFRMDIIDSARYENSWMARLLHLSRPLSVTNEEAIRNAATYMSDIIEKMKCQQAKKCYPWHIVEENRVVEEPPK